MLTPLRCFCCITSVVFIEVPKCVLLHTQFSGPFQCRNSTFRHTSQCECPLYLAYLVQKYAIWCVSKVCKKPYHETNQRGHNPSPATGSDEGFMLLWDLNFETQKNTQTHSPMHNLFTQVTSTCFRRHIFKMCEGGKQQVIHLLFFTLPPSCVCSTRMSECVQFLE